MVQFILKDPASGIQADPHVLYRIEIFDVAGAAHPAGIEGVSIIEDPVATWDGIVISYPPSGPVCTSFASYGTAPAGGTMTVTQTSGFNGFTWQQASGPVNWSLSCGYSSIPSSASLTVGELNVIPTPDPKSVSGLTQTNRCLPP
jgi:hypothetical protein